LLLGSFTNSDFCFLKLTQLSPPRTLLPPQVGNDWEKRVNSTVNMMLKKKQLAHAAGHMGSFRLSKSMAAREEKRLKRGMKVSVEPEEPFKEQLEGVLHGCRTGQSCSFHAWLLTICCACDWCCRLVR
jgi:hypothetical protein